MRKLDLCTQNTPLHIMVHISFTVHDIKILYTALDCLGNFT